MRPMSEVINMQATEVYEILLMDFEQSEYRKDLQRAQETINK